MSRLAVFLLTALLGANAMAADVIDPNRTKEFGDITVRYNTFTSSFLQPDVAAAAGLVRSKNQGVLNIAVLKAGQPSTAGVSGEFRCATRLIPEAQNRGSSASPGSSLRLVRLRCA